MMEESPQKRCTGCHRWKDLSQFWKQKGGKYGRQAKCIECAMAWKANYYSTPEGKEAQRDSTYRYYHHPIHRGQRLKYQRQYRLTHLTQIQKRMQKYWKLRYQLKKAQAQGGTP